MALQNNEQSRDLLHAQAHIFNHAFSFVKSMSLKCAIQLQIPDIINRYGEAMPLSELMAALSIKKERSQHVYRLMHILVHSGFFNIQSLPSTGGVDSEEKEGYLLTTSSRLLVKEEPLSIRPLVLSMWDPMLMDSYQHMSEWFQNDDDVNPFQTVNGKMIWDVAAHDEKFNRSLNEGMASDGRLVASVFLKHCHGVFEGLDSIVDVGGGTGTLARCIAEAFPTINCINFDLPHVVKGLDGGKNLSYVGGDMFEAIPKANAVLMKWILHDWSDEECINILMRCKEAIPSKEKGGKVIIIDVVVKNEEVGNKTLETQLILDMMMMTLATGKERSKKDWAKLFVDAGFRDHKITRVLGLRSVIEVYP